MALSRGDRHAVSVTPPGFSRGRRDGTRFRIFPQTPALDRYREPDTICLNLPPGSIRPGPTDARIYVIDALDKPAPYDEAYRPPYRGPALAPVEPGPDGHFDHLEAGSRAFNSAHLYATVRFVLEIWEDYLGGRVDWHFRSDYPRLELIPHLDWDNAQSGYGFIETGYGVSAAGIVRQHCLNFDVIAHELGHSLIYSVVGIPHRTTRTVAYFAFHEAAADLTALVAVLHFESVVDRLLEQSRGNLHVLNELNRIGELSAVD